jgi:hypothetical protein
VTGRHTGSGRSLLVTPVQRGRDERAKAVPITRIRPLRRQKLEGVVVNAPSYVVVGFGRPIPAFIGIALLN